MLVSEVFHSIQGEGLNAGIPAIFVRLAGCNLRCKWCDTKYAYEGKQMSARELIVAINKFDCKHVIWTGGEPMLQDLEMFLVIDYLRNFTKKTYHEIETNGTKPPTENQIDKINLWNVSPKSKYIEIVRRWGWIKKDEKTAINFKFVIDGNVPKELENIKAVTKYPVMFMPQGITEKEIKENSKKLIPECIKLGIRYSSRIQVMLWGTKRGK